MTPVDDLVAWLTRIFDEQESAAKACEEVYPSPWEVSDRGWMAKVQADQPGFRVVAELEQYPNIDGWLSTRLDHLALHDPASVLARIAADRQILARCMKVLSLPASAWEYSDAPDLAEATIRDLAQPYADREGFREEWRA